MDEDLEPVVPREPAPGAPALAGPATRKAAQASEGQFHERGAVPAEPAPIAAAPALEGGAPGAPGAPGIGGVQRVPLRASTIALMLVASFGAGMATIVPMAYSLALRVDQLAPGREHLLGYVLGVNAISSVVTMPLTGILSDRTRSRWGRRRPYVVVGTALGLLAVPVMVLAPSVLVLAGGWMLCSLGFGTAAGAVVNLQADQLPPSQRGKVSGLTGLVV